MTNIKFKFTDNGLNPDFLKDVQNFLEGKELTEEDKMARATKAAMKEITGGNPDHGKVVQSVAMKYKVDAGGLSKMVKDQLDGKPGQENTSARQSVSRSGSTAQHTTQLPSQPAQQKTAAHKTVMKEAVSYYWTNHRGIEFKNTTKPVPYAQIERQLKTEYDEVKVAKKLSPSNRVFIIYEVKPKANSRDEYNNVRYVSYMDTSGKRMGDGPYVKISVHSELDRAVKWIKDEMADTKIVKEAVLEEDTYRVTSPTHGVQTVTARSEKEALEKAMRKFGIGSTFRRDKKGSGRHDFKVVKESAEQLDEISVEKAIAYLDKAMPDRKYHGSMASYHQGKADVATRSKSLQKTATAHFDKYKKREKGERMALDRMTGRFPTSAKGKRMTVRGEEVDRLTNEELEGPFQFRNSEKDFYFDVVEEKYIDIEEERYLEENEILELMGLNEEIDMRLVEQLNEEYQLNEDMRTKFQKAKPGTKLRFGGVEVLRSEPGGVNKVFKNGKMIGDFSLDTDADMWVGNINGKKGQIVGREIDDLIPKFNESFNLEESELSDDMLDIYSDVYKDVYGVRPRGREITRIKTRADFDKAMKHLQKEVEREIEADKKEKEVQNKRSFGAKIDKGAAMKAALKKAGLREEYLAEDVHKKYINKLKKEFKGLDDSMLNDSHRKRLDGTLNVMKKLDPKLFQKIIDANIDVVSDAAKKKK